MNAVIENEEKTVRPQPAAEDRPFVSPNVNIVETKEAFVLEAELPGVAKEGLEISLDDNELTIVGRRQPETAANILYRESNSVDYRRSFALDPSIDAGKINARIEQGILTVTLPKAERSKPRQITVS